MVTGDNSHESGTVARQRLNIERTVREHRSATIQRFLLRTIRIHVHHDTGIIVRQVRVLPTSVHHTTVIHHYRVPVCVLIESQTAQALRVRRIKYHITDRVITAYTRHALITDIRVGDDTSVRQVGSVVELQIRLLIMNQLLETGTIQFHLEYVPTLIGHRLGKHSTIAIPMHPQVGDRGTVFRFIDRPYLYILPA